MFGAKGLRKRVGVAVERTLEPGESVESTVYLHVYGDPTGAILTGLPVGIRTWIVALTDKRVILLKGNEMNAAKSEMIGGYPRADVSVSTDEVDKPKHLELTLGDKGSARFAVPLIWRDDAATFAAALGT